MSLFTRPTSIRQHNNSLANRRSPKQSGTKMSKFERANFLAWDGEGLESPDGQKYGLLANSKGHYWINPEGLSTDECLAALTSDTYTNNTIHVCFGASYDVNMMLRDLTERSLRILHKGEKAVWYKEYEIRYMSRKSFSVRRCKTEVRKGKTYRVFDKEKGQYVFLKTVTLWDVFGFFQKKFVSILSEWTKGTIYEETYKSVIDDIIQGKQKRGQFKEEEVKSFVLPYCLNECYALRDVMHILHEYLQEAGLVLSRWDGAGAVAAALMKMYNIKQFIKTGDELQFSIEPDYVISAAEYAYYGGWVECFKFGHIQLPIYHYDLRSAYPHALRLLLSLAHGEWKKLIYGNSLPYLDFVELVKTLPEMFIAHISWECPEYYEYLPCPFSWRHPDGRVCKPLKGKGWQWSPEIRAALKCYPDVTVSVDAVYYFEPSEEIYPFDFIPDMYKARALFKRLGKGIEKVYKLGMNSLYGKLAQSLGYDKEKGWKPPYHCLTYAGMITSITRALIMEAIHQHKDSIISIATDGIYSLEPLDLDEGEGLGQWESTPHEGMTIVQSGVYWYITNSVTKSYYRGFNEGSISQEAVIQAYQKGLLEVPVKTTRFITIGSAIGLNDFRYWRTWRTTKRMLDLWMVKSGKRQWKGRYDKKHGFFLSASRPIKGGVTESAKYKFEWDEPDVEGIPFKVFVEDLHSQELGDQ